MLLTPRPCCRLADHAVDSATVPVNPDCYVKRTYGSHGGFYSESNVRKAAKTKLQVDTGAQMSVLTSGLAERLGLMSQLDRSSAGEKSEKSAARELIDPGSV